ncbi:uncharacterized protein BCR38DRAFT_484769 [Pseudomassariella vexata]|uniref:NUC153 domain-containing protein n=1 Tax=Pseudomassariella vexata TaxID=1141098 RepID=A0A1Y2E198_9PEZI|nr:uncharacterized protein BCR38DRAFT_484769 [Pseudomassariella vexata]ORY65331.1 hypothetical protein BCR38DRAFT_484769 [Pseudomassariella vexata]
MPKKSALKKTGSTSAQSSDARFASFESDPRFRLPSKSSTKTKIDRRFSRMLKDDEFIQTAKVDQYGRKLKADHKKKALKNLYEEEEEDDVAACELQKADASYDPARGGGFSSSDSESEPEVEAEEDEEEGRTEAKASISLQKLPQEQSDVETGEVTKRIAIVNLDWDHIRAIDLMALFASFVPKGGKIERISIYPSEFGKERMQREELEGPPKEIFKKGALSDEEPEHDSEDDSEDDDEEDEEDEEANIKKDLIAEGDDQDFDSDALRSYQLDRLRYFYAVMSCSDTHTAQKIYEATDGTEYQTTSNFLDLRFVPDDVTFDDQPRDECDSIPSGYKPNEFVTDALQHSKVKLTWDMHPEEASRRKDIEKAFSGSRTELQANDLRAYLASDSEDDAQEAEDDLADQPKLSKKELSRQKMREALGLGPDSSASSSKAEGLGEKEMTFTVDDLGGNQKAKKLTEVEETTIEKYKRKERERKALKKEKALAKREGIEVDSAAEEEPKASDEGLDLGFDDPFFTTDEPVKASKNNQRKEERIKRRQQKEAEAAESAAQKAQLQRVMGDDMEQAAGRLGHFDMNEITRAEKKKSKKAKHIKKKQKDGDDRGGLQEGFRIGDGDVDRFKAIFESHEFAIDASDPKFKPTPAMKQLLEESRKKRNHDVDEAPTRQKKKVRKQ